MLPAFEGDCLWLEYGDSAKPYRILIDGGPIATGPILRARIEQLPVDQRRFELVIITHIDSDHIAGILKLLADPPESLFIREAWFNGYKQLAPGYLGPLEGEFLTVHLLKEELKRKGFWNGSMGGTAVGATEEGDLHVYTLAGGMELTVLGPGDNARANLRKKWKKVIAEYGMTPGSVEDAEQGLRKDKRYRPGYLGSASLQNLAAASFEEDTGVANDSSIVVFARYENHTCLLAADARPSAIESSLRRLPGCRNQRVQLSAVKVPHHGSAKNNSNSLFKRIDSPRFLISSSGAKHRHPDPEAISRILVNKKSHANLYFNYSSVFNERWADRGTQRDYEYAAYYPAPGYSGLRVEIT